MIARVIAAFLSVSSLTGVTSAQIHKLFPDDVQAYDQFGSAIALSDDLLAVAAQFSDGTDFNTGAVYLWRADADGWSLEDKLTADGAGINHLFGRSVAIDGDVLVAGTEDNAGGTAESRGSAVVFERRGGGWREQATLEPAALHPLSRFGWSVDVQGQNLVVGAPTHWVQFELSGAAWTYRRQGGRWVEEAMLLPADAAEEQLFGHDVAVDGDLVAVSGVKDSELAWQSGAVYVFRRAADGTWTQQAKLTAPDADSDDGFGSAIALDRGRLVIGSPGNDDHGNTSGSVYVFGAVGDGWELQQKLTASDADMDQHFGQDVSISGDTLVVGSLDTDGDIYLGGATYVFHLGRNGWRQQAKVSPAELVMAGFFGSAVAVDGHTVAGGAYLDSSMGEQAGAAYVLDAAGACAGAGADAAAR